MAMILKIDLTNINYKISEFSNFLYKFFFINNKKYNI